MKTSGVLSSVIASFLFYFLFRKKVITAHSKTTGVLKPANKGEFHPHVVNGGITPSYNSNYHSPLDHKGLEQCLERGLGFRISEGSTNLSCQQGQYSVLTSIFSYSHSAVAQHKCIYYRAAHVRVHSHHPTWSQYTS